MHKETWIQNKACKVTVNSSLIPAYHMLAALAITLFLACLSPPVLAEESVLQLMEREFQAIVKSVQPLVVEVVATCTVTTQKITRSKRELLVDDLTSVQCYQNIGSGIIIDSAGHIVTTAAVVENADGIEVVFADGQRTPATLLGIDTLTDIAALSVESNSIPPTKIGDSDQIDTGSWVIMVGSSYGHSPTLSFGTVSGLEILPNRPFYDAIKINAPVNPGNSGGAVVNTSGEIVGVIAATLAEPYFKQISHLLDMALPEFSRGQGSILHSAAPQGQIWMRGEVSFAIPIKTVKQIADQLTRHGKVPRGWLGVRLEQENERTTAAGVRVTEVLEDTSAQRAGIKPQDVIVEFNGKPIRTFLELKKLVANSIPETHVTIKIRRDGQLLQRDVVLGEWE